jgi:hypothetical protein
MIRLDEMAESGLTAEQQVEALTLAVAELGVQLKLLGRAPVKAPPPPRIAFDLDGMILVPVEEERGEPRESGR